MILPGPVICIDNTEAMIKTERAISNRFMICISLPLHIFTIIVIYLQNIKQGYPK